MISPDASGYPKKYRWRDLLQDGFVCRAIHIVSLSRVLNFRRTIEIVESQTLASSVRRAKQRVWLSVRRASVSRKYYTAIKNWKYSLISFGELFVPQLKVSSIFFFPILVQIQNEIQASSKFGFSMMAIISMNSQPTSSSRQMVSSPLKTHV